MHVRTATLLVAMFTYTLTVNAADITLVKHAKRTKAPQANQYIIREGDTLRKILMEVYKAREEELPYLYKRFRQDNPTILNLDDIQSGTRIIIPRPEMVNIHKEQKKPSEELEVKQVGANEYVIKEGEHLAKILRHIYGVSDEVIFHEYMGLIKKLNPEISDPNRILAGQKIRVPDFKQVLSTAKRSQVPAGTIASATTAGIKPVDKDALRAILAGSNPIEDTASPSESGPSGAAAHVAAAGAKAEDKGKTAAHGNTRGLTVAKNTVLPALKSMGGLQKDSGTYFLPMAGGSSFSLDTSEIPVMELDTGRKIIFDMNNMITPDVKAFIEKAFPSFRVVSGSQEDLEGLMDKVLSVSGYFSVNKDASPLLVGEEEKLRFSGKWIVYKDFSRRNVFVVNLLNPDDLRTPASIRRYAGHFGIDLIELGGRGLSGIKGGATSVVELNHSYKALFDQLSVGYESDKVIDLVSGSVIRISFKAPLLAGKVILTDVAPQEDLAVMLKRQSYVLINAGSAQIEEALRAVGLKPEGPPVKIIVAQGRTELEIPGIRLGNRIILKKKIDQDILSFLALSGLRVLVW